MKHLTTIAALAATLFVGGITAARADSITIRTHDRGMHDRGMHRSFDHSRHYGYRHREISTGSVTKIKKTRTNAFGERVTMKKVIRQDD